MRRAAVFLLGFLLVAGFWYAVWRFATTYLIPPNLAVVLWAIAFGVVIAIAVLAMRRSARKANLGPDNNAWAMQSWNERNGQHSRVMH